MADQRVYKILSAEDWALAEGEGVSATDLDNADGYVHLSTGAQVGQTLALHYRGVDKVRLLAYQLSDVEAMGDVRWEPSRGGDLFPHLYGALRISDAKHAWVLELDSDGVPILPEIVKQWL